MWAGPHGNLRLIRDIASGLVVVVADPAAPLPAMLRPITASEIRNLLGSSVPAQRLAGLQAAALSGDAGLMLPLLRRVGDHDPTVAAEAAKALSRLSERLPGAQELADATIPGAVLFALPGWRREKLQALRWLGSLGTATRAAEPTLVRALGDHDWEIRMTAMLAAGRLGTARLAARIAKLEMPEGVRAGLTPPESRLLLALRDACLLHLGAGRGRRLPDGVAAAVLGDSSGLPPQHRAFVCALTEPLSDELPAPPATDRVRGVCRARNSSMAPLWCLCQAWRTGSETSVFAHPNPCGKPRHLKASSSRLRRATLPPMKTLFCDYLNPVRKMALTSVCRRRICGRWRHAGLMEGAILGE